MTTMKALEAYGLNTNEIIVFEALVTLGGSFAKDLIKHTKFHKNIIYDNLYKLQEKGLVSEIIIDNKKYFQCEDPESIEEFIQNKQKEFQEYDQDIKQLKSQIKENKEKPSSTITRMFTGIQGVKQIFSHELQVGEDYFVIGAPKESVELLGEHFWSNFIQKQKVKKMKGKIIFNESLRKFSKTIQSDINEIRFLERSHEPLTEICIFDKYVATIVWSKEPVGTLIESEQVAKSYKAYFQMLWKNAKK